MAVVLALDGVGCGAVARQAPTDEPDAPVPESDDGAGDTGADFTSEFAPDQPAWTTEDAVTEMEAALGPGIPDLWAFDRAYDAIVAEHDDLCPTRRFAGGDNFGPWVAESCTTTSGFTFDGDVSDLAATVVDEDGSTDTIRRLGGWGTITNGDGCQYYQSGQADIECAVDADANLVWNAVFSGGFQARRGDGWAAIGGQASVFFTGTRAGDDTVAALSVHGGVHSGTNVLDFEAVSLGTADCGASVAGELRIQDPTGYWWRLAFGDGCEACGRLRWESLDGGEVCLGSAIIEPLSAVAGATCR